MAQCIASWLSDPCNINDRPNIDGPILIANGSDVHIIRLNTSRH